ncbi:unnamed protein product, partial [Ixodes hexagonus]
AGQLASLPVLATCLAMVLLIPTSTGRHRRKLLTDNDEIVEIHSGHIQGFRQVVLNSTIHSFLGIPFAEPPVGDLRFRKPVPVKPWDGVKPAFDLPPRCVQPRIVSQEDCLYLNVWTPTLNTTARLDVMVYFHGGLFLYERPLIQRDLRYMASMGQVVIVKMNYRLGAFGFLHAYNDDVPGNMGIHDMHLAMLWVRRNIKAFGGSPCRITAFGSSAGAMSIGLMLTSPIASHLIQGAILQSGSPCVSIIARENITLMASNELAFKTGCATGKMSVHTHGRQVVACLRRVSIDKILSVQATLFKKLMVFLPIFGDDLLPVNILHALRKGLFSKDIRVMVGVTPDEGTTILSTVSPQFYKRESHKQVSKSQLFSTCNQTFLHSFSKSSLRKIYWKYMGLLGHTNFVTLRSAISSCIADYFMVCPSHVFAEGVSKYGVPVYFYQFDYRTKSSVHPPWMGVIHTAELNYLFGEPFATSWYTDKEREFSKTMVAIWATFAKTG